MSLRSITAAAMAAFVATGFATGAALAVPVVVDPNFNATATSSASAYYGIAAWGAQGLPASDPAYNPSFAGNVGQDANNQWNDGTPGNGQAKVGFLSGAGAYIFQTITGFTVGDIYKITLLVNARVLDAANMNANPAGLQVTTSSSGTLYSGSFNPVEVANSYQVPFQTVNANTFVANATSVTVRLTNTGTQNSSLLLSGFAIADQGTSVPEPLSVALLGTGLLGLVLLRRSR